MPRPSIGIPDELLLAKLGDRSALSDELWITASQLGMLLCRSADQLAEDRKVGNPPPFSKPFGENGGVRYRLGTVRNLMEGTEEFNNTTQARIALARRDTMGLAAGSFQSWVDNGSPQDEWPFLVRKGRGPIDFWISLTLGAEISDEDKCTWLSLDHYLKMRRRAAWNSRLPKGRRPKDAPVHAAARSDRELQGASAQTSEITKIAASDATSTNLWYLALLITIIDIAGREGHLKNYEVVCMKELCNGFAQQLLTSITTGGLSEADRESLRAGFKSEFFWYKELTSQ